MFNPYVSDSLNKGGDASAKRETKNWLGKVADIQIKKAKSIETKGGKKC